MIIPRGGDALHKLCREQATIPVMTGGIGICHLFVDASADQAKAVEIIHNAKTQRPSVCNSLDTVLVHRDVAVDFLPQDGRRGWPATRVELRADPTALPDPGTRSGRTAATGTSQPAGPDDFDQEWLSLILGVKVVGGLDEAIDHIAAAQHRPLRRHPDRKLQPRQRFVNEVELGGGLRQRQHPLQRRRPAWPGRRGGRQHAEAARPRADGLARADDVQVGGVWGWAGEGVRRKA